MIKFFSKENIQLDFIIVGTQKGGTSALAHYLKQHKDIQMSRKKELHFFDNEEYFKGDRPNYKPLNNHFGKRKLVGKIYGEATPIYMYWDKAISRIHTHNPEIKLIAVLRNPVERAYSHWNMEVQKNKEQRDFTTCITDEISQIENGSKVKHRTFSYVDRGLYADQIEQIFSFFTKQQVLFIKYEDFLDRQKEALVSVFNFLNISSEDYIFEKKTLNKIEYSSSIQKTEKLFLTEFYRSDVERVEKLLNWDCESWKN
tara:strand:+ start:5064 stop:5834 length:771 start_codon:yes stop_codon:yes gene_type:complete